MRYLVELVFGAGLLGLAAMVLSFVLRFLLLTWAVQLVSHVVQGILGFLKELYHAVILVFGPAILGAFVTGLGLQIGANLISREPDRSADPTMPILIALLAFFVIIAVRGWQWQARHRGQMATASAASDSYSATEALEPADYPDGYEGVTDAWNRAINLAPKHRADLLKACAICADLVTAVEHHDGIPDSAMIATAALIRNNLAALVDSTERRLRGAKSSEKSVIIGEMVKFLLGFTRRAQNDLEAANSSVEEGDAALRAHLTSQLFGLGARSS